VFQRLEPDLERVDLKQGQVIFRVDAPIVHLHFVEQGLISLVKTMQDGRTVEIGAIGIEGGAGCGALVGMERGILDAMVQVPGTARRIRCDTVRDEIAKSEAARRLVQRYVRFAVGELAQTAACNRLHSLEQRCCRWLLIAHDSAGSDAFPLTHEFLAMMLGVQRAGVSLTAKALQKVGLIRYSRGRVTVVDRPGLEAAACECYGTVRAQFDRLYGRPIRG
jgi:CRP-like cAMP-binding protein